MAAREGSAEISTEKGAATELLSSKWRRTGHNSTELIAAQWRTTKRRLAKLWLAKLWLAEPRLHKL